MERTTYTSSEERAVELLRERLGKLTLIKDKDGKPVKWEKKYPAISQLEANCKKEGIDLPKNPKINDILVAMVQAGYRGPQRYASPDTAIKNLSDRVFDKEMEDLDLPPGYPPPADPPKSKKKIDKQSKQVTEQAKRKVDWKEGLAIEAEKEMLKAENSPKNKSDNK